jgi:3-methyladenine DNA glycosylase/8-oxoguanine DNA glycosylase
MRLKQTGQFSLTIPEPFNFQLTVAKPAGWHWSTPGEIFEKGTLWCGVYLAGQPVGLKMSSARHLVNAVVYSGSNLSPSNVTKLKTLINSGLGADENLASFYRFARKDPVLSITVKDLYGMRVGRLDDVFGRAILAILLQMAPLARSNQMMDAVLEYYGTKIEFDHKEVILWPRPQDIAAISETELRNKAKLGYRAVRLIQAADYISKHDVSLLELSRLPEEEALKRLIEIPGIGKYSAGIIYGRTSVPVDVWSVVIMSELVLGRTPQNPREEVDSISSLLRERWGKWGWMAFVYILNDLEHLSQTFHLSRLH